jgi:hypothetical protein
LEESESEKLNELLDGQTGLPDDAPESARLQIAPSVDRHRHRSGWISGNSKDMVATGNPVNNESRSPSVLGSRVCH